MTSRVEGSDLFAGSGEAAEFIDTLLESSTEHSFIATDAAGGILLWNEGARRLYGHEPAEIVGQSWTTLHTEADVLLGLPGAMAGEATRDGKWEGTVQRVRRDGTEFTARVVVTPRRGSGGKPGGFLLISTDITEQVRIGRELDNARRYAQSLLESAPDAMVIVDSEGQIKLTNAETEKLFGYSRDQLIGQSVDLLIPARFRERHPGHRNGFFATPRTRRMGAGLDLWARRGDGVEFPVEVSLSPLETEQGLLATAAIRDVTERMRVEHELRDANSQLEGANRSKDRFLASMSHELRTPLNAILGFTGTLLMGLPGPLNSDQEKQLRTVQSSGRHLLSLINDLLDLARIEAGKLELNIEEVECRDLLEEVVVGLRPLADDKAIGLEVTNGAEGVHVHSDRRSLSQILINLTNNAIKFTDEGGVRLALTREDDDGTPIVRFSVIDTGKGIQDQDQQQLFAAFEQIGGPSGRPYEGTGLGLYICQTLAAQLGASIDFESEYGEGSTFTLEVPVP